MKRNDRIGRRANAARFFGMATFALTVLSVIAIGSVEGRASAQNLAITPRAFLALVVGGANPTSPPPSPTPTATVSPTPGPTVAPGSYDQVHLAWVGDPSTTLSVVWRTKDTAVSSAVQYREPGATDWQTATGGLRPSWTTGTLHEVSLTGLNPRTAYEYRVRGPGGAWSATMNARTAPEPGPANFDAVFFADTGIIGRTDGLASGTQQVIDEIGKMKPWLLLGGGDYAYFNSDTRFATLDDAIDAWFNQMQPVAAQAPLMPTYGNHEAEVDLQERYESWAARFPTPDGSNERRNYSFDVGDVCFISLFAPYDWMGVTDEQIAWLEQTIIAAKARGMRWIIPYFHVVMFGDGDIHDANLMLREDLGPVFERHGVKLVLYAHDQAYERSYPLRDVPNANTPTSSSLSCYTSNDGVVYVKVSPSGKRSSQNGSFSPFKSSTKPAWTAVRDNSMHHFARLRVAAEGSVTVEAWGVQGDGSPPALRDSFKVTTGQCP